MANRLFDAAGCMQRRRRPQWPKRAWPSAKQGLPQRGARRGKPSAAHRSASALSSKAQYSHRAANVPQSPRARRRDFSSWSFPSRPPVVHLTTCHAKMVRSIQRMAAVTVTGIFVQDSHVGNLQAPRPTYSVRAVDYNKTASVPPNPTTAAGRSSSGSVVQLELEFLFNTGVYFYQICE